MGYGCNQIKRGGWIRISSENEDWETSSKLVGELSLVP